MQTELRRHLHRVFDLSNDALLAFRLTAGGGDYSWALADDTLSVVVDGVGSYEYDLAGHTISTLTAALVVDGLTVTAVEATLADLSAVILADGAGGNAISNGDRLFGIRNLTLCLLDALGDTLSTAEVDLLLALAEMDPLAADGEWADYWGRHFGIARRDGELDADYTARIFEDVVRPRSNALAIELNLSSALGATISVFEPWTKVIYPSGHACTPSRHRIRGGKYWQHCIIHPSGDTRENIAALIGRQRAGGIHVRYEDRSGDALSSVAALTSSVLLVSHHGMLPSSQVRFLESFTPPGTVIGGNEPVLWAVQNGVMAHVSLLADGYDHQHSLEGLRGRTVPSGWLLTQHVWIDPSEPPDEIVLGWHVDGVGWKYGGFGSDTRAETPKADLGALPSTGGWVLLQIDPADVGVSGTIDGLFFGLHSGRAWFGPSGAQIPMASTVIAEMHETLESGGFTYEISGVEYPILYAADGTKVYVSELSGQYPGSLYRLDAPDAGAAQLDLLAGHNWPLGDLIAKGYLAGHDLVDVTEATYTPGASSISTDAVQVS